MSTSINIRAHHVEITQPIKEYVEKKLGRLDRFFNHMQEIAVDLDISDVSDESKRQTVTVTVWVPGTVLRAKESSIDMYASVDQVFEKLEKQLVKYKEKLKDHRHDKRAKEKLINHDKKEEQRKDRVSHYIPKPMHPEEAAERLQLDQVGFLMFRNATTEEINVVYVNEDGDLELIEP